MCIFNKLTYLRLQLKLPKQTELGVNSIRSRESISIRLSKWSELGVGPQVELK